MAQVEQSALEMALAVCDGFGYDSDLVRQTRQLCGTVSRINEETEKAQASMDEHHVRTCVTAADGISMDSEWLSYFRELVNGDELSN